jgi:hypothetical protein
MIYGADATSISVFIQESDTDDLINECSGGWSWSTGRSVIHSKDSTPWTEEVPTALKTRTHNMVTNKDPIVKGPAAAATTMLELFKTMITKAIISDIVRFTNQKAEDIRLHNNAGPDFWVNVTH